MNSKDLIVVDVQPCYRDSVARGMSQALVQTVRSRLTAGEPVWLLYNNEELTGDTRESIHEYWTELGLTEEELEACRWVEKTYAFLRGWMDNGIDQDEIVSTLKVLHKTKRWDTRNLEGEELRELAPFGAELADPLFDSEELSSSGLGSVGDVETCGGGRDECLLEVELWLASRGVSSERLHHLTY